MRVLQDTIGIITNVLTKHELDGIFDLGSIRGIINQTKDKVLKPRGYMGLNSAEVLAACVLVSVVESDIGEYQMFQPAQLKAMLQEADKLLERANEKLTHNPNTLFAMMLVKEIRAGLTV